jgi:hypothetical protein
MVSNVALRMRLIFISVLSLYSCNNKTFDNEEDLMVYLEDQSNGYIQHKTVNGVDFLLMYRPTDLLVSQDLENENVSNNKLSELKNKYSKYMYLNLSMSKNNQELLSAATKNRNEFGTMVNRLAFDMNDKVHLYTQNKDTLKMLDFIYPRMYGMSKSTTLMFVYSREKLKQGFLNFTIEDIGLYTGEVKFKIDIEKIIEEPRLSFKN